MRRIKFFALIILGLLIARGASATDYYWENPVPVTNADSRFPSSATNGSASVVIWQEVKRETESSGVIWLSARVFDGSEWHTRERFAGPIAYAGDVPSVASVTLDAKNRILVSVASAVNEISILSSTDWGATFTAANIRGETDKVLAPRVFVRTDGGYLLFATRGGEDNFTLVYSRSDNGTEWSSLVPFGPASGRKRAFLPTCASDGKNDVVVFQAFLDVNNRSSYQLYSTISTDRGQTWSTPTMVTAFTEPGAEAGTQAAAPEGWHNQRARLARVGKGLSLVWERARTSNERYAIYYASLGPRGDIVGAVERVSSGDGTCYDPDVIVTGGAPTVVWFDDRRGSNRVYMARKEGLLWAETDLSKNAPESVFGRIVNAGGSIEVYWQETTGKNAYRVERLAPDRSVQSPRLIAENFAAGGKGRGELARLSLALPEDSSGLAGYSWAWGQGSQPDVPKEIGHLPQEKLPPMDASSDGVWYLGVRAADYAGNWSSPVYVAYTRDTTPPAAPVIEREDTDAEGYLASNTFNLSWRPSEYDDVAGYTWSFDYVAPLEYLAVLAHGSPSAGSLKAGLQSGVPPSSFDFASAAINSFKPPAPPARLMTKDQSASFSNMDNGIYALSVSAIDSVGNIGAPAVRYVVLNKYVPFTYITYVDSKVDEAGSVSMSIIGRGFAEGGLLSDIYLDKDGVAPYDITLSRKNGQFTVVNDRLISGITLNDVAVGEYRVGLTHPTRGLSFSKPVITVTSSGTIKFGDYRYDFTPPWKVAQAERALPIRPDTVLLYSILALALAVFFVSMYGIASTAQDSISIRAEVKALIEGDIMPSEKKKRSVSLKKKGMGLRFKLAFFTTTLVISVVLIVSIPLGLRFSANQERTLAQGLQSRVEVLLESLASGARAYLPSQNVLELGFLPAQMSALDEAISATITGNGMDGKATGIDFVWATNDSGIASKIDTAELAPGRSRYSSPENAEIDSRVKVLDDEAVRSVGELSTGITSLTQEGIKLALKTDTESVNRRDEIQTITRQLEEKLNAELARLSAKGMGSYPEYNPLALSRDVTRYVFYKPVMYRRGAETAYVRGTVRVEVSTESLLKTVGNERRALVGTTALIALIAVLIGVVGALVLASIIISPIRKLAAHVAMIRDTEDKEALEGKDIALKSRDEIGLLGETINDMTHGLVKAAAASKDLTVGKEVQKMFIPLETDSSGKKLTCGSSSDANADFFGYYEGAKGVSGDYFDYIKLDDRHYALIKCDVAGKGVPAALIMVEVATLFLDYFKDWKYEKQGYRLDLVVSRINDLIESRGFKGRFAAFTMAIFDSASGDMYVCNAGDNLMHVYDASSRKMRLVTLPECSAAGVFPSFMVDMKGGFKVVKQRLNPGDVAFFYTDGIEEAKRLFRTEDLAVYTCAEPGLEKEAPHGNHSVGQDNEELGPERVNAIIEAVLNRRKYSLSKWHNPERDAAYDFDFTDCEGTIEEAILALVSVEKVFRMYLDPKATEFDRVQVDRKVDGFLNRHFKQYSVYCGKRKDHQEHQEYLYYTNVREDAQYDDLTILGIKKR